MDAKRKYLLFQGYWGLVVALGGIFAVFSFNEGRQTVGFVVVAVTVVLAAYVYAAVDRQRAQRLVRRQQ